MSSRMVLIGSLTLPIMLLGGRALAKDSTPPCKPETAELAARAKVTCEAATRTAQARFPKGKVESSELEEEDGKLIYSFDIRTPHRSGIDEVEVDALTGAVVKTEHETPSTEAKEKKEDEAREEQAEHKAVGKH